MLTTFFTRRPVFALVVSIVLSLLGLLALRAMPITLFPDIAPPEVNVTFEYTGANAEVVTKAAVLPIERAVNGVPGMKYMSSNTGNDGVGLVEVYFEIGTDPDVAAINVQNRVNQVMDELPPEVVKTGVRIAKEEKAMLMYLNVFSSDPGLDEKFLYNFVDINVLAELRRIPGVGFADILGAREYAVRVWLKPDKLIAAGLSPDDVVQALKMANVEAAPGKIGENSDRGRSPLEYAVKYTGKFITPEQYARIPIRANVDGEIVRIEDVAEVEFGTAFFDVESRYNGRPSAALVIKQLPHSNAREVIKQVKARLAQMKREVFLPGMDYELSFDVSRFLDASVREVVKTFIEAFLLVGLVVFLFLRDWRSTLIPLIAVPVSLIGTFAIILPLGFSLNLITLFALVLAIGIVVDNAIVVVEAVHARLESDPTMSVRDATEGAMGEIAGAIIAITLVMSAVFVPVAFISGPAGVFYRQFSVTMAVSIVLSGVIALTLTPALCVLLLEHTHKSTRGPLAWFERQFGRFEGRTVAMVTGTAARRVVTAAALLGFVLGTGLVGATLPSGFIPVEDQGTFYAAITTPPGATLERTKAVVDELGAIGLHIDGVESIATLAGSNILTDGTGPSYGTVLVNLKPWDQRTRSVNELMEEFKVRSKGLSDAQIEYFAPPPVPGYGNAGGFELRILDKSGRGDFTEMDRVVQDFLTALRARPEIAAAFTIFQADYPQYLLEVDLDKAAHKGVTVDGSMNALQTMLGSEYVTNFIRFGQMYKVMVQAPPEYRARPEDVLRIQVKNDRGELVPLSAFVTLSKTHGVDKTTRYNMYPSAEVTGDGRAGFSTGEVLAAVQEVAKTNLPRGFDIDWAGISRDQLKAGNEGFWVFLICLVFVFLVLSAQYESFVLPLVVVGSLPPGVFGALGLLKVTGLENNIYAHVALIMLIGLLGKNAILVVEFAELKRKEGATAFDAVVTATRLRLRPILMTSFAFVAGLVPLAIATGAGAVGNRTIGTAAVGGMLVGTLFGALLVPGLYVLVRAGWRQASSAPVAVPEVAS
ncbi:MAG: efflux RND transporter permease subunit [Archangium sp.]|nr:efflux RND transporter permease subunit [Archangium sp.]MDP3570672.1 efflux RND transporter permease subunit [Archangium sp.]